MPGSPTPTSRILTCPPQRPAARSSLLAATGASRDTTCPGPASPPAAPRTPRPHVSLHYKPGEGRCKDAQGARGTSPNSRFTESSAKRPRGHLRAFQERRHPSPRFSPRDTAPGVSLTLRKNSELFTGPHSPQFDTLAEPTHDPSHALGRPPRRRQFLTVQKCPGASRDSCLRAPRPRPVARAASAPGSVAAGRGGERGRHSDQDSPSARPPQRGGEGQVGEDTIWQSTTAAPGSFQKPPPGRRGN